MIAFSLLVAASALAVPAAKELTGPIFYDLEVNAMIGNGNDAVDWEWWYGIEKSDEVTIRIRQIDCRPRSRTIKCSFILDRSVLRSKQMVADSTIASALSCKAILEPNAGGGWNVKHYPPKRSGHSRTSMRCKTMRPNSG